MGISKKAQALTMDEWVERLQPKLNMIGSDIDLSGLYHRGYADETNNITEIIFSWQSDNRMRQISKIFGQGKPRSLLINDKLVYGELRGVSISLNIKTLVIDISKIHKIEQGFIQDSGIERVIFIGSQSGIDLFNIKLNALLSVLPGKAIKYIYIPQGTKRLWHQAFYNTRNLEYISIPSSVKSFENGVFYYNNNLKEVHIRKRNSEGNIYIVAYKVNKQGNIDWHSGRALR